MNNQTTKKKPLINRSLVLLFVLLGTFAAVHMVSAANDSSSKQTYQQQLQSQVDTTTGAPIDGRNPASQTQTTLAYAASQPAGPGQQVDKPAAAVTGTEKHVDPTSVLPDTKNTGVLAGGCLLGYGVPGAQCVQVGKVAAAQAAGSTLNLSSLPLTCDPNGQQALQGIQLISTNLINPSRPSDKAACNISDLLSTTPLN
jgi:hypothetical protein